MLAQLFILLSLAAEPAEQCPAPPRGASITDIIAHLSDHIAGAAHPVPACEPAIAELEIAVCSDDGPDLFSRAATHAGLRQLAEAQGDSEAVELHCCLELALRRRFAEKSTTPADDERRVVNQDHLELLQHDQIASCTRSPICTADVLAPGFLLTCDTVAAELSPPVTAAPAPALPTNPVTAEAPRQHDRPPAPQVNRELRRAGVAAISLAAVGLGVTIGALITGMVADEKIAATAGETRVRWHMAGRIMNPLAISAGIFTAAGTIVSIPLLLCSRARGCPRHRPTRPTTLGLGPGNLTFTMRF